MQDGSFAGSLFKLRAFRLLFGGGEDLARLSLTRTELRANAFVQGKPMKSTRPADRVP